MKAIGNSGVIRQFGNLFIKQEVLVKEAMMIRAKVKDILRIVTATTRGRLNVSVFNESIKSTDLARLLSHTRLSALTKLPTVPSRFARLSITGYRTEYIIMPFSSLTAITDGKRLIAELACKCKLRVATISDIEPLSLIIAGTRTILAHALTNPPLKLLFAGAAYSGFVRHDQSINAFRFCVNHWHDHIIEARDGKAV